MAEHSFGIKSVRDFWREFDVLVSEFLQDDLSSRKGVVCAIFGYHLVDWMDNEGQGPKSNFFAACPSLSILRDITNGTKHCIITKYSPSVSQTGQSLGAFQRNMVQRGAFQTEALTVHVNGTNLKLSDVIMEVHGFWSSYFASPGTP